MTRFIALIALLSAFHFSSTKIQKPAPAIDSIDWLAGCWMREGRNGLVVEEQWMKPAGGTMIGMSRTVRGERTLAHEFLRIVTDSTGNLHYVALPSGQKEASFKLTVIEPNWFVAENPSHDFPQKIMYKLVGTDSLEAKIEGMMNGTTRSVVFPMKRKKCGE